MIKNMTTGNPTKALVYFAMPMLIGNIIQQLNITMNAMMVGRHVGVNELAAIGASTSLNFLFLSAIIGLTGGISVIISQYFGASNDEKVSQGVSTAIILVVLASTVMSVLGIIFAESLLVLLRTPANILDHAVVFLTTLFIGILPLGVFNGFAAILRAFGNSMAPLIILVFSAILNIVLNFVFIVSFDGGIRGAALAIIISQLVSAILVVAYAYKFVPYMRIKVTELKVYPSLLKEMLKMGVPAAFQMSFLSIGNMMIQVLINGFGTSVVAAYTAAIKICFIAYQPAIAFGTSISMFIGQNIGAGKINRVKEGLWSSLKIVSILSILMTIFIQLFPRQLLSLFIESSEIHVINIGESYLRIISTFYIVIGIQFVIREALRGTGDALVPMGMGIVEITVRLISSIILSSLIGYVGIWWATPIGWAVASILGIWRYRSGYWQKKAMVNDKVDNRKIPA